MAKQKESRCKNCKYFKGSKIVSKCKRFPPPNPDVDSQDFCGEFKKT